MEQANLTPQWMDEMQKWQQEDTERRSAFCLITDLNNTSSSLMGYSFPLVMALLANMLRDEDYANIVKGAYLAMKDPSMLGTLLKDWKEFKKEHGWPMSEEDEAETEDKPGIKSFLKDILKTIADKL